MEDKNENRRLAAINFVVEQERERKETVKKEAEKEKRRHENRRRLVREKQRQITIAEEPTDSENIFIRQDTEGEDGASDKLVAIKSSNRHDQTPHLGRLTPTRKMNLVATADERIRPDYNTLSPLSDGKHVDATSFNFQ